jgi:hypothetical protein
MLHFPLFKAQQNCTKARFPAKITPGERERRQQPQKTNTLGAKKPEETMSDSHDDDERFRRQYAKALAEALLAKEDEEAKRDDDARRAQIAYTELSYDDPILSGGDEDCRRLAMALVPTQLPKCGDAKKLGLSTRLVDGVLQSLSRAESKGTSNEGMAELAFAVFVEGPYRCIQQAENLTIASTFLGSFEPTICGEDAKRTKLSSEEKSRLVEEATAFIVKGVEKVSMEEEKEKNAQHQPHERNDDASSSSSSDFFDHNNNDTRNAQEDYESIEEVFAEESDPDDFEYESEYCPPSTVGDAAAEYDDFADSDFDAITLSKPNKINTTWDGARKAMYYLISNISYGKLLLASIPTRIWLDMGLSDTLADFSFMLLLHHANCFTRGDLTDKAETLLTNSTDKDESDENFDIAALWDRPLILLRDRAFDDAWDHDALIPYLQLLQAFLTHSENDIMSILSSPPSKQQSFDLPPITSVGLSGLATLCSSKEFTSAKASKMSGSTVWSICPREEIKKTIMESLHSLARALECVRPRPSLEGKSDNLWIRTAGCIFPIIEYLTNLRSRIDFQSVFEGKNFALTKTDAACVLESGLFRELLAMYAAAVKCSTFTADGDETSASSKAGYVTKVQLLRTIYSLSVSSPEVLGSYAVRVPAIAKEVQSSQFMEENLLDGILWTSLSSSVLESKSDIPAPRLKLRVNTKSKTAGVEDDVRSMSERSFFGFSKLCSSTLLALVSLKEYVATGVDDGGQNENVAKGDIDEHKRSLGDFINLANCLGTSSNALNVWINSMNGKQDFAQQAKEKITKLRSVLTSIPSYSSDKKTHSTGHKKIDDDEDTEQNLCEEDLLKQNDVRFMQKQKEFGVMVASVRLSVKMIGSALESHKGSGLSSLKGGVSHSISSKSD